MKEKLIKQGSDAARRAIRHYLNGEHDQFFIQAAASFELLGKARLTAIHPSLIVDRDFDSFLHACGEAKYAKKPPWNIKTITATEVLKRCTQIHPELSSFEKRLTLLADFRNSTIHLGEVPEAERTHLFRDYLAGISAIAAGTSLHLKDIFADFTDFVSKQLDQTLADVQRTVEEKLARAKDVLRTRFVGMPKDAVDVFARIAEAGYKQVMEKYRDDLIGCPVCEYLALASGEFVVDWDVDYDDHTGLPTNATPVVTLVPSSFHCQICGLELDGASELKAAGLPETIEITQIDPADFFDEPDYA